MSLVCLVGGAPTPNGRGVPWVGWWPILLLLLLLGQVGGEGGPSRDSLFIVDTFEDDHQFTHLTVNENTGMVYTGGVNRLHQLDPNLRILQSVVTGPLYDSVQCPPSGCNGERVRTMELTQNHNKVLVIDYARSELIVCGTVRQGSCQVRDLRDISTLTRNVSEAIAANNASASTVAFIAEGPSNPSVTHVLYIGVTHTGNSVYRQEVPAVASRSLEDDTRYLDIAVTSVVTSTRMWVNSLLRERYPITYVYGFGSDKFSYFLTRQMEDTNTGSPYISKLVRVCQNDSAYNSYTEIPIECKDSQGKRYNLVQAAYVGKPGADLATQLGIQTTDDVLFAVFSPSDLSEGEGSPLPAQASALCVYSMKSVRQKFLHNIQECFAGKGNRGLDFISPSHKCINVRIGNLSEDFCGIDVNTPLGGEHPVEGLAILTFPTHLTAVTTTSIEGSTVVFLGTAQGHLKKIAVENQNNAFEYDDIVVNQNSPVGQDMYFNNAGDHLYIMTSNKISKVKAQECSIYDGCNQCLGARDPYCGWCSSENKCSLRRDCRDVIEDPQHWLSYKTGQCTTITQVMPQELQRTVARTLSLKIDNLPSVEGNLQCVFSAMGIDLTTNARRSSQGVTCTTPRNDLLPDIPQNEHHFTAKLSLRKFEGPEFVSTNYTFFDCNTYNSCTECVSSLFPCDWCVDNHRCTHDSAENCRNDVLVNGINRIGPSTRSGPSFCPRISVVERQVILVSSGTEKYIRVKVDNIAQFITQTRFVCQFNIEGRVTSVLANLLSDTIYCDTMKFAYNTLAPFINVTFSVLWGGSKPLDNPDNIHVQVYQCHLMADNCGMCLTLPEWYECGWCQSTNRCEMQEQCHAETWLDRDRICPDINITNFYPKSGPWTGGTNVTIEGINLGKHINDIYEGITVAGLSCQPYHSSYIKTKQVTCKVDSPGVNNLKEGPIVVKVAQVFSGESMEKYRFVNPEITDLTPVSGPRSGGTLLHIIGKHMNAGSRIEAFISGRPCNIQSTNMTMAICITTASPSLQQGQIEMYFDNGRTKLEGKYFTYVDDPAISLVRSGRPGQAGTHNGPHGIPSGGIIITVDGINFDIIREPKMYVVYGEKEYTSPCEVKNSTRMECKSPAIPDESNEWINGDSEMKLDYGFIMDNVKSVRNPFTVYHKPEYFNFEGPDKVKEFTFDVLIINGRNLNRASNEIDIEVLIGSESCNVISLSQSQLICRPPKEQPEPLNGDTLPQVEVIVGGNLRYEIGYLKYAHPKDVGTLSK